MATSRVVKYCNGFRGCREPIFTGTEYKKLRRNKQLCIPCYDAIEKPKTKQGE